MWKIELAKDERGVPLGKNRFDRFRRRNPEAVAELFELAQQVAANINAGTPMREILARGSVHREGSGVYAFGKRDLTLRLYWCAAPKAQRIVILTIGDKHKQTEDVNNCIHWATEIRGL